MLPISKKGFAYGNYPWQHQTQVLRFKQTTAAQYNIQIMYKLKLIVISS